MKLVIPLAGFGSRMRPHTWTKPKPLINIAGKPFLGHLLDKFACLQIDELVIIYGWLGSQIQDYVQAHYAHLHPWFVEQTELHGQSHALWQAREHLHGDGIIVYVDTFFEGDLSVINCATCDGVAFVKRVDDPRRFGVVERDGEGYITRFIEKPVSTDNKDVVIGLYWFRDLDWLVRAIEEQIASGERFSGEFFLTGAYQLMVEGGAKLTTHTVDVWQDTGKPETTLQANRYLLDHGCDNSADLRPARGLVLPPCNIAPGVSIENAIVGPYVSVSSGAVIRNAVVRNSLIDAHAVVEDIYLEGSLIGEHARVKGQPSRLNVGNAATAGIEYVVDESWE
ncbi:MAG: NTP transferase domain-containing protein [Anaerolineae bacterium]|nr:NTP transferase domain-containing protein [Anaerolineae bacterium]